MGKCKNATQGGAGNQKGASPIPPSHDGDTGEIVLMEEVASLEKVL